MNFKEIISSAINFDGIDKQTIISSLTLPPDASMGDFSLPCFVFSKTLHASPVQIAQQISQSIDYGEYIEKVEVVGGYLNFYLNKSAIIKNVISNVKNGYSKKQPNGKVMCIDYSSVNLAKYMHIGHWATTIIGEAISRLYENQGYKVVRMNYVGDYGLPFGKMMYGYLTWGNKQDVEARGIDALQELYVKFCASENEELLEKAREYSKKIEEKDEVIYPIYEWFIEITKKEAKRLLDRAGITFDTWRGESYYNDKMDSVIDELKQSGLAKKSEGALIVDLNEYNLGVSVIQRSDGASLYVTRDIAALEDRYKTYNFDEMIYVTAIQQCNHFDKLFKLCELLGKPYKDKLYHAAYGMFSLPEGKIASRKGKQALFEDLLNEAEENVALAMKDKNFDEDKRKQLCEKIGKSAVAFSILKVDRIKDKVFDKDQATSFDGETAPYIEYTLARINSILKKAKDNNIDYTGANLDCLNSESIFGLCKQLNGVDEIIYSAFSKKEPSVLAREVLSVCKNFNKFYGEQKVINLDDILATKALCTFVECIKNYLVYTMPLLCIELVEEM